MTEHARFSPSAAHRWIACPGSVALEEQCPASTNAAAEQGTALHEVAARLLDGGSLPSIEIDELVKTYVQNIRQYAEGHTLLVEQKVDFSSYIGAPDSFGTSDAIIFSADGKELQVHDFKTGYLAVYAENNEQLMLYALGAWYNFGMLGDFKRFRMVIHQPKIHNLSEWDCSLEELLAFAEKAKKAALLAVGPNAPLTPGEEQCRWCRAKTTCPALNAKITQTIGSEFLDLTLVSNPKILVPLDAELLADKMNAIEMIEAWCKAVRAGVESLLLLGRSVPGYKLVEGKRGNRIWTDKNEVETLLKSMRFKQEQIYDFSLISPTDAEKLLAKENPKRWAKLQSFISRSEGKPHVAPASDKRPALSTTPAIDNFENLLT